jgi:hypothetical protein
MQRKITKQYSTAVEGITNQRFPSLRLSTRVIVGLLSTIILTFSSARFAGAQDLTPAIRVRVDNYTPASPAVLAKAELEASRILGAAGLRTIWLDCQQGHPPALSQDPCRDPLETTDLVLRIVSKSTKNKFQDTVFGFAVRPVLATVYYDYPVRLARSDDAEFELPLILGSVIAHEIGHLLLGPDSHSDSGIMQPRWKRKQVREALTGALLFTPVQAESIQAATRMRMNSQIASLQSQVEGPLAH